MDEEVDEMFAFLTFFKICKMYQVLRRSRHGDRIHSPEERPHNLPAETKVIQHPDTRRNFAMFSQTPKKLMQNKPPERSAHVKVELETKNHLPSEVSNEPPADHDYSSTSKLNSFALQKHLQESSHTVDPKSEMCFSDWQVSEQVQLDQPLMHQKPEIKEQDNELVDENRDIIDTIFNQINDNDPNHDDVEATAETQELHHTETGDIQISIVFSDEDASGAIETTPLPEEHSETLVGVVKKKRRRRRRPGDPPLSPLPKIKKRHKRRYKVRPEHINRFQESYYETVFKQIRSNDEARFLQHVRMTRKSFDAILKFVRFPMQQNKQTIRAEERLCITLLYLAHGMHFDLISEKFKLGRSTIRIVVLQTCELLWDVLSPTYMRDPTSEDYVRIADDLKKKWNIPNCAGVLGTKLVPFNTCRRVPGYKWNEVTEVVLLAACDANHIFRSISITVEPYQSQFYKSIVNNTLPLPPGCPLADESTDYDFPYYFLGNEAFPQRPNLMRPFGGDNLSGRNSIYNYSLSCGQGVTDTAFNIITTMWRVLLTNGSFSIENWGSIMRACIVLHNFVMINEKQRWYQPDGFLKSTWSENVSAEELREWIDERYPVVYVSHLKSVLTMAAESNETGTEDREVLADYFCIEETNS